MGKISHLINENKPQPAKYQLEGVIASISELMAQSVSESVYPHIANLSAQSLKNQRESTSGREKATSDIQKAVKEAVSALKPEIKKVADALSTSNRDMVDLQGRLVSALSNVRIPDYSDDLRQIKALQPDLSPVLKAIQSIEIPEYEPEERADEWVFDIQRHQNGLIKSVTAKAK